MDLGLKGKIALVTGASRGLGYATALLLAREGANVVINGRNAVNLAAAADRIEVETGVPVLALPGDVTDPAIPASLVDQTVTRFDTLDLLFANAGGPKPGAFESLTDTDWMKAVDLCLMAHVRLIRAALPIPAPIPAPSVLTVTSFSVKQPIPNLILSNSVRGATVGLTKTLALELGNQGIRFNSILPAWTETERIAELLSVPAPKPTAPPSRRKSTRSQG